LEILKWDFPAIVTQVLRNKSSFRVEREQRRKYALDLINELSASFIGLYINPRMLPDFRARQRQWKCYCNTALMPMRQVLAVGLLSIWQLLLVGEISSQCSFSTVPRQVQ
jgi:hypothetical protein